MMPVLIATILIANLPGANGIRSAGKEHDPAPLHLRRVCYRWCSKRGVPVPKTPGTSPGDFIERHIEKLLGYGSVDSR